MFFGDLHKCILYLGVGISYLASDEWAAVAECEIGQGA